MTYQLDLTEKAQEDIAFHKKVGNKAIQNKLFRLLSELSEHPMSGTGSPEQLKYELTGLWSRRINGEHRLIYEIMDSSVLVLSAKGHY